MELLRSRISIALKVQHGLFMMIITKGNSTEAPHIVRAIGWLYVRASIYQQQQFFHKK